MTSFQLLLILVLACCVKVWSLHDSLNFILHPGRRECFYEDFISPSLTRVVETFVEVGGLVDVKLTIFGPLSLDEIRHENFENPLKSEAVDIESEESTDNLSHRETFTASIPGTYAFCLDNREAHFVPKTAQIDIRLAPKSGPIILSTKKKLDEEAHDKDNGKNVKKGNEDDDPEAEERVKETLSRIQKGLAKIQLQQQRDRRRLAYQDKTNSETQSSVIMTSIVETAFFIGASLFQIVFVRRWFATRNVENKPGQSRV